MFKSQCREFTNVLIEKGISRGEDREIIIHGLSTGIELIFNIITTIVLGLIFGLVLESIIFLISFSLIRTYAGGYHCKKVISCYFFSSTVTILVLLVIKFMPERYVLLINLVMLFVSVPVILYFAPIDAQTKPLDNVEKQFFRKKVIFNIATESCLVALLLVLGNNAIAFAISNGIAVSMILLLLSLINKKQYSTNKYIA